MAITSRNDGYKISQLEEIEGLKRDINDSERSTLDSNALFVVSNTDDAGMTYSSRKLKYSDLATSLATSMDRMFGGDGGGTIIGNSSQCCFEEIGVPGNDYPIANVFFPNQKTAVISTEIITTGNTGGIWFGKNGEVEVPDLGENKIVNVNVFLSAYSSGTPTKPGIGIYVVQTDLNNSEIFIPIKDQQLDSAGWSTCLANFLAKPGTRFGGYIYNPITNNNGKLSAFFRLPMPAMYEGEDEGESYKIYFRSNDLTGSVINETLSSGDGFYEVRSSIALTNNGKLRLEASLNRGNSWNTILLCGIPTNAGSGSSNTKLRIHPSIYIPSGCLLRAVTDQDVNIKRYVTNRDPATIYLIKKEDEQKINASYANGIAAVFNASDDKSTTETFHFKLAKPGKLNINWNREPTSNQALNEIGVQMNYTSVTKHDGQWNITSDTGVVIHQYSSPGDHLAYIGGASADQRILAFNSYINRNCITELSTYSPTVLSAACLSGLSSLKKVYSNAGNISSLQSYCLKDCSSLTSVYLSCDAKLAIAGQCFMRDTSLENLKIVAGDCVTNAFGNSFANRCSSLTSVTLPKFSNKIGDQIASEAPFNMCYSLSSLSLSATSTGYIQDAVARNCPSLKEFSLIGGCKIVNGYSVFDQNIKNSLSSLSICFDASPYTLDGSLISGSPSLETIYLDNVKITTSLAFRDNTKLSSIVFNGICGPIASKAFSACQGLKEVVFEEGSAGYISKTLFGARCFQISPLTPINMYFPDDVSTDTIEDLMKYNTGSNSILYADTDKGAAPLVRIINAYRLKARGHINIQANEVKMRIGQLIFKHTKDSRGISTYDLNWDMNELYDPEYDPVEYDPEHDSQ